MKKLIYSLLLLSLTVFVSCTKEYDAETATALMFTSEVDGVTGTRATGTKWGNDAIGIFMVESGSPLAGAIESNRKYVTNGTGIFSASSVNESISLPPNAVDFVSYYPYKDLTCVEYPVDLTDQSSQEALDLLYSSNAKSVTGKPSTIPLTFDRQLTKLVLEITAEAGLDVSGIQATIQGMNTKATFNLADGSLDGVNTVSDIPMYLVTAGQKVTAEAVILPVASTGSSVKVLITLSSGIAYTWNIPAGTKFEKGKRYAYTLTLKNNQPVVTASGYFETPVITEDQDKVFIQKFLPTSGRTKMRNFSMLYDKKYKLAYWVAYPLHATYMGSQSRTDRWAYDPDVAQAYQPNLSSSYDAAIYDRGHQLPSADRTYNAGENATTFFYTNMTAQYNKFNQGEWALLETQIRSWTNSCDTMYVVTGAMITTKTDQTVTYTPDSKGSPVALPKCHYKALAQKIGNNYYTIAFKMYNEAHSGCTFNTHRLTVSELEAETGFTFFPSLTSSQKGVIDASKWN